MQAYPAHTAPSTSFDSTPTLPLPGIAHVLQAPNPDRQRRTINPNPNLDRSTSIPSSPSSRFLHLRAPPPQSQIALPSFSEVLSATIPDLIRYHPGPETVDGDSVEDSEEGVQEEYAESVPSRRYETVLDQYNTGHRMRAKPSQIQKLTERWNETRFPTYEQRKETAIQTGLTSRQVQVWFQNRRSKEKKLEPPSRPLPQVDPPTKDQVQPAKPSKAGATLRSIRPSRAKSNRTPSQNASSIPRRGSTDFPPSFTPRRALPYQRTRTHPPPDPRFLSFLTSPYNPHPPFSKRPQRDALGRFTTPVELPITSPGSTGSSERIETPSSRPGTAPHVKDRCEGSSGLEYKP